ncbi:hypothetical protein [Pseudonocardia lacus]|uniref:hypothetical protein n=1 Tax=Pseudonocardia lacus TaxID=2835865 RepID=UPI001BDBEAE1|nr:hypothetical protein [Pseudonocardia lacus]
MAGASVVALYALWLNDRRRRTEEARQGVEEDRLRLEGDRVTNERFARSIEMLGNEADQVRLGAMHALAGPARANPAYAQTVVDVLCAYLRRPFFHRAYEGTAADIDRNDFADPTGARVSDAEAAEDRERQVRLTAQRLPAASPCRTPGCSERPGWAGASSPTSPTCGGSRSPTSTSPARSPRRRRP